MLGLAFLGLAIREGFIQLNELDERHRIFRQAKGYANSVGKPLLVVGTPKHSFSHPCGDVTIDVAAGQACDVEIADVRNIPYPNNYFGACYCSHVLEHLPTIRDAFTALSEMYRVADRVFTVSPHKTSLIAQLVSGHHLWITPSGDGYIIEQRGKGEPREASYVISMEVY